MRAMPRAFRRPHILVTGASAGPELRYPPDPAGTRGIARMTRSYEERECYQPISPCTTLTAWPPDQISPSVSTCSSSVAS